MEHDNQEISIGPDVPLCSECWSPLSLHERPCTPFSGRLTYTRAGEADCPECGWHVSACECGAPETPDDETYISRDGEWREL